MVSFLYQLRIIDFNILNKHVSSTAVIAHYAALFSIVFSLKKNPAERPNLKVLSTHQFLVRAEAENVDFAAWVQDTMKKEVQPEKR